MSHDPYAALRLPPFRWFVTSVLLQTLGTMIQAVVVGWQVYRITKDPLSLGLIGLAEALPFIAVALYAGHVADRVVRRSIVVAALAVMLGCALALLGLTVTGSIRSGQVWPVYLVILVSGVARSFLQPARTAFGAELVPRPLYVSAIGWRSASWQLSAVAGPALGGLLYGFSGPTLAYSVDCALILASLLALGFVPGLPAPRHSENLSVRESLTAGLGFLRGHRLLLGAFTLDLFAVLFGGAEALLPIFAADILRVGPQGLGLLRAAPAGGAVLTSVVMAHRGPMTRAGRNLMVAVSGFGLCMIGFGLSRSFALSWVLLFVSGMADQVSVVLRSTLLQVLTPQALLGRVSSINSIFIGSSNEIGAFESGVAAKLMGTVPSVVLGGLMTLLVVGVTSWRVPQLRKLERLE